MAKAREPKVFRSMDDLPLMLTPYDLMDFLGKGQRQTYELIHSEGFPYVQDGPKIKIPKWLLIEFINEKVRKGEPLALNSSLTDETVPYQAVNVRLKKSIRERAKKAGTLIFVAKGDTVEIDEGVNTLTSPKSGEVKEMGSIRVSSTIDYVVHDLELFGEEYKKAKSNTDSFRATYATTVQQQYLDPLVAQEILKEGASYEPDPDYYGENATKKAKANEAFFVGDITPNESPEKIYQKLSTVF